MAFCPSCGGRLRQSEAGRDESGIRLVTVLFGDVKGYTAMSENLPPEEVSNIMSRCFEALADPVNRYGGTVDKIVGDAIMVRFGAPQAHEDDAVRAIYAALEMQQALTAFSQDLRATTGQSLAMRIGINTGQVFAGQVGAEAFKQYTLMGNAVNLASRLEHAAEPGSVLVGESTYRLARHVFEFRAMPPMEIRGQSRPVASFVPVRPIDARTSRTERRTPFMVREKELALLAGHLEEVRQGQGRIVALVGDPGVGKSRLTDEFMQAHVVGNMAYLRAVAPSFGQSIPYSLLAPFIRGLLLGEDHDTAITPESLCASVERLVPREHADDVASVLAEILGVRTPITHAVDRMESRSRQAVLINAVKTLLASRAQQGPFVVVLEDVHWADAASLEVLDRVLTSTQVLPVLTVVTHRPHFSRSWSELGFYAHVNVSELSLDEAREFIGKVLGSFRLPAAICDRVIERAGGNPFFLEQFLMHLIESEFIVQRNGTWVLSVDLHSITVPDTIQEIVLARIDQLGVSSRSVLEIAATIGISFAHRLLAAIIGAQTDLDSDLSALQRQQLILEKCVLPELEYAFKHSLTRDVVYSGLLESRRRVLHEQIASILESIGGSAIGEHLSLLAFHYKNTANHEKALEYSIAAGDQSRRLHANEDAARHYRQAIDLLEIHASQEREKRRVVLEALGDVHEALARFEQAREWYVQALAQCDVPSDRARMRRKIGDLWQSRGRYADAVTAYRLAEQEIEEADDVVERAGIWLAQARVDRLRGALESSSSICLRALSLAHQVDESTSASLYFELGEVDRERGRLRSATGFLETALHTWERLGALEKQAVVACALADVSYNRGELHDALEQYEKAYDIQQRVLDRHAMASTLYGMGRVKLAMGDLKIAGHLFGEGMALAIEVEDRSLCSNCLLHLGIIALERHELEPAEEHIDRAYSTFKQIRNWRGVAFALVIRARLHLKKGAVDDARASLLRSEDLVKEMHDDRLHVHVFLAAADLAQKTGDLQSAAGCAGNAISLARNLSDSRMVTLGERVLAGIRARQDRTKEALVLFESSIRALRRLAADVDAAHAILGYANELGHAARSDRAPLEELLTFAHGAFRNAGLVAEEAMVESLAGRLLPPQSILPA